MSLKGALRGKENAEKNTAIENLKKAQAGKPHTDDADDGDSYCDGDDHGDDESTYHYNDDE